MYNDNYIVSSRELAWIAQVQFSKKIGAQLNPHDERRLDIWERIAMQCERWWPFFGGSGQGAVIASERPTAVHFDDERRLHCENGPAVEYADGYALYAWHGVRIPEGWVTDPASLTARIAFAEKNVERRRAAIDKLGWERVLAELDAKVINQCFDPLIGELMEVTLPKLDTPARFLHYRCLMGRAASPRACRRTSAQRMKRGVG